MVQLGYQESRWSDEEGARIKYTWQQALETFAGQVVRINEKIELLKLKVPFVTLQRP